MWLSSNFLPPVIFQTSYSLCYIRPVVVTPHAAPSLFFSFLTSYWHAVSHLQLPHFSDSVLTSQTFPSLPTAALLDLHQFLFSPHLRTTLNLWFPSSILPTCFSVLICSSTGSLLSSFSPLWQYLQCWVSLHFCPTQSTLKSKTKPNQTRIHARSSSWYFFQSLVFKHLRSTFINNNTNTSSMSSRRLRPVY